MLPGAFLLAAMGCGDGGNGGQDAPPVDTEGPEAVTNFTATWNETTEEVDLAWTNPSDADFAGVVLVRSASTVSGGTPSASDTAGTSIGTGSVIYNAPNTSTNDTPSPGLIVYEAWAYDESGNLSTSATAPLDVPTPVQNASIQIDPTGMGLTVNTQPDLYNLSGTVSLKRASATYRPDYGSGLIFEATTPGTAGNGATVQLTDGGDGTTLAVSTVGQDVTVTYDFRVHTNVDVANIINGDATASAVLTATPIFEGYEMNGTTQVLGGGADNILTVDLNLQNTGIARLVFNAKAYVTAIDNGTVAGSADDGTNQGAWFGARGLEQNGITQPGRFEISAYTANPINLTLEFKDDPTLFVPADEDCDLFLGVDSSGESSYNIVGQGANAYTGYNEYPGTREAAASPDGRWLATGARTQPYVYLFDLTTFAPSIGIDLGDATGVGTVESVKFSPNGDFLYATVTHGTHAPNWYGADDDHIQQPGPGFLSVAQTGELVKIAFPAMTVVDRVELFADSTVDAVARNLSVSSDGTLVAVAIANSGQVALVNTTDMTLTTLVDVSAQAPAPRQVAVSPDGTKTYVGFRSGNDPVTGTDYAHDGTILEIDNSTFATTTVVVPNLTSGSTASYLDFGPDGKLYYGRKGIDHSASLSVYDTTAQSWNDVDFPASQRSGSIVFAADGQYAFEYSPFQSRIVRRINLANATHEVVYTSLDAGGYGHLIAITPY